MASPGCWTVTRCQGLGFYATVMDWNSPSPLNLLQEPGRFIFSYVLRCLSVQSRVMEDALTVGYRGWMMLGFRDVVPTPACTAQAVCPQASPLRGSALLMKVITGDGTFVRWCVAVGSFSRCLVFERCASYIWIRSLSLQPSVYCKLSLSVVGIVCVGRNPESLGWVLNWERKGRWASVGWPI